MGIPPPGCVKLEKLPPSKTEIKGVVVSSTAVGYMKTQELPSDWNGVFVATSK